MEKLIVTGAGGFLGSKIVGIAKDKYDTFAFYHTSYNKSLKKRCRFIQLDITNKEELFATVRKIKPQFVIHCAALARVDYCESHRREAYLTNTVSTKNIGDACKLNNAKLVYVSTDSVFDGNKDGSYIEEDRPNPLNYYSKTKLDGEKFAATCDNHIICRVSTLYGWQHPRQKPNFAFWLINQLKSNREVKVVTDQYSNPTFIDNAAENILALLEKGFTGIIHITGKECLSRYEFAKRIVATFGLDGGLITPCSSAELKQIAKRPKHVCLDTKKARMIGLKLLTINEGLIKMKQC